MRDLAQPRYRPLVRPLQEFLSTESAGGILLLIGAAAALIWVNAPFGDTYEDFWHTRIVVDLDAIRIDESLVHWVNDAAMAVFFFVVGMEIKREFVAGELANRRSAMLPICAALGGMIAPAAIYFAINAGSGGESLDGWGIPMATDIAFAVGILTLVKGVPLGLKVFLLALAIVDDLGAIAVIAIFYTDDLSLPWLLGGIGMLGVVLAMNRLGVRDVFLYLIAGVVTWLMVYESGVHATVAGVALGLITPLRPLIDRATFASTSQELISHVSRRDTRTPDEAADELSALRELEELSRESQPVLERLEHALHPWTSYIIIPIFALANAGVAVSGDAIGDAAGSTVTLGVIAGLAIGKPLGIFAFGWVAVRAGIASLPSGTSWRQFLAVGQIAGIGFTVSLFISGLAFTDPEIIDASKIGILTASAISAAVGLIALRIVSRSPGGDGAAAKREPAAAGRARDAR
ncbi:MAG TPA: Na+/H+ antiporter NhaA [Dehalococcoidia bacterium]|nr:Na+/H+ antiporter NhaA [Dehalococcoidia bacterium]